MFIFHEGLPGSGKSYEAMKEHIIPALEKGRPIYTNMEGILEGVNKTAELIGKTVTHLIELINIIPDDEVRKLYTLKDIPDVLVVVDELQDYYPSDMRNIPQEERSYVAKHEHYGHDIIGMGQNLGDVNKLWRNRCARKLTFMKRGMIGKPDQYTWTAYQGKLDGSTGDVNFIKLKSGGGEYEEKYFGTYKSVNSEVQNARQYYEDDRTNLLKSKWLKIIPIFFLLSIGFIVYVLYNVFSGSSAVESSKETLSRLEEQKKLEEGASNVPTKSQPTQLQTIQPQPVQPAITTFTETPVEEVYIPVDYFDEIAETNKLRLSAVLYNLDGEPIHAIIDAYTEDTNLLVERFYLNDVRSLGWSVTNRVFGLLLTKSQLQYVVRPWPLNEQTQSTGKPTTVKVF